MGRRLCIITPCFEDIASLLKLTQHLASACGEAKRMSSVALFIINDSPWQALSAKDLMSHIHQFSNWTNLEEINTISLSRNVGHQRGLVIGLSLAYQQFGKDSDYLLMDCDGEDQPKDVPRLFNSLQQSNSLAVVAAREKRHEGLRFQLGYQLYKWLFRLLSGKYINFGNFMILSPETARAIIHSPDAQTHLASTLLRSRFPMLRIGVERGRRYQGTSKMGGMTSLVHLGIKSISTFAEDVITRLLIGNAVAMLLVTALMILLIGNYFLPVLPPIPGWTSVMLVVILGLSLVIALQLLNSIFLLGVERAREGLDGNQIASLLVVKIEQQKNCHYCEDRQPVSCN